MLLGRTNREGLDVPLHHVLLGHPLGAAGAGLELGRVGIAGHRHQYGHVVSSGAALELTPGLREVTEDTGSDVIWRELSQQNKHVRIQMEEVWMIMQGARLVIWSLCAPVAVSNRW